MKISIIIPVYNKVSYISSCIESLLHQDFDDLEIICVDDGSTDGSGDICDVWSRKDNRIKVIHIENSGVTAARRTGVEQATGKYIVFVDSDDMLLPKALDTLFKAIERNQADEVIGRFSTQYGTISPIVHLGEQKDLTPLVKAIVANKNHFPILWGLICRKEIVADCLDTPREINEGEDLLMQLKVLMKHPKVHFINDCVYLYKVGMPNNRKRTLEREKLYDQELKEVLKPEWEKYEAAYITHQIKQYEEFLIRGDFSVRKAYYAQAIPSSLPAGVPRIRKLFWLLPPKLSVLAIQKYRQIVSKNHLR